MITEHTDLYAEYLKIKVKHTRYESKAERKIDSLQKEIDELKTRHKKEVAKLRLELIALKREAAPERTYNQSNEDVIQKAADFVGCSVTDLKGKWRLHEIVIARHILFYYFRYEKGLKLMEISRLFNRDHSTVVHAIKNVHNYLSSEKMYPKENQLFNYLKNEQQ
jgi:chromosomal replication initiation ATPase DnaA